MFNTTVPTGTVLSRQSELQALMGQRSVQTKLLTFQFHDFDPGFDKAPSRLSWRRAHATECMQLTLAYLLSLTLPSQEIMLLLQIRGGFRMAVWWS